MKKNIALSFILSVIMFLSFATPAFAGLGISPSDWVEPHALVGQQMTKTFMLSRSDAADDLYFTSEITGDIISWLKIDNGDSFIMPKGAQELPVKIIVTIPANAPFKNYKGEIRLNSATKEVPGASGAPIGVLLSSLIRINLTVSDKTFLDYSILQISIPQQKQSNFLNVNLKIWNQGNIEARPTKLTMDIFDKFNTTQLGFETFTDFSAVTGVAPFSEGEMMLQIPMATQLTPEKYWAKIDVYQDDKVLKSDDITFDITKSVLETPISTTANQSNNNLWSFITIPNILYALGIILILGLGIDLFIKMLRKNKRSMKNKNEPIAAIVPAQDSRKKVIKEIEEDIDRLLEEKIKE